MSEMDHENSLKADKLDQMSTEELESLLRDYSQSLDDAEMDIIFSIIDILGRRERANPSGRYVDVEDAWTSFQKNYRPDSEGATPLYEDEDGVEDVKDQDKPIPPSSFHRGRVRGRRLLHTVRVLVVVLLILLSGTLAANALGYNFWMVVAKWTNETFGFVDNSKQTPSQTETQTSASFQNLKDALTYYEINTALAPTWIPDGYSQTVLKVNETPAKTIFIEEFSDNQSELIIKITRIVDGANSVHEKDDEYTTVYETNGIAHYIMSNNDKTKAVWVNENFECSISGDITTDDMKKMIDSIYEGVG